MKKIQIASQGCTTNVLPRPPACKLSSEVSGRRYSERTSSAHSDMGT